jgi:hypothetical protein
MGGHTVGLLCGQRVTDPADGNLVELSDDRIKAGVLMAPPGRGEDLAPFAKEHYPILGTTDFSTMTTPALIVLGENDWNAAFSERKDWRADAYFLSPGPKSMLMLHEAEHGLGGVSAYDAAETTDENPERVAALRALVWAYLRTALHLDGGAWSEATTALRNAPDPMGTIASK